MSPKLIEVCDTLGTFAVLDPYPMKTHYEKMSITEEASEEMIRAAYKVLAWRLHPDRNEESEEANQAMQGINEAYEVLSDKNKRQEYDRLLVASRRSESLLRTMETFQEFQARELDTSIPAKIKRGLSSVFNFVFLGPLGGYACLGLLAAIVAGIASFFTTESDVRDYSPNSKIPDLPESTSLSTPRKEKFVRSSHTPIGTNWPTTPSYVDGYEIRADGGLSSVEVDNSQNSSDVFVKLIWLSPSEAIPARACFIPAKSSFTFEKVRAGRYDVRYRDLTSGNLAKTEEFLLEERKKINGTTYSNLKLTLFKVFNGNMKTEKIDEEEF